LAGIFIHFYNLFFVVLLLQRTHRFPWWWRTQRCPR